MDERIYAERVDIEKNGSGVRKSVEAKSCKIKVGKVSGMRVTNYRVIQICLIIKPLKRPLPKNP